jgi:hypothetical protein
MISVKISTNYESFNGFRGGRRIDLAISHGYTHMNIPHEMKIKNIISES